jgi:hypothetical protein
MYIHFFHFHEGFKMKTWWWNLAYKADGILWNEITRMFKTKKHNNL